MASDGRASRRPPPCALRRRSASPYWKAGDTPIVAHGGLGLLYLAQGDLEHAARVLEQGLALCRASGLRGGWLGEIVAGLGYTSALQGCLAEGPVLQEEAISESIRTDGRQRPLWVSWLSEVCRLAGRGEEARQHSYQALDLARQQKARGDEAYALHQLGTVHAHADPPDAVHAEAYYRQALALAKNLGMRPLQAHCHLALGSLYGKTGRPELARAELSAALDLYHAMDMTFWLPQARAPLAPVQCRIRRRGCSVVPRWTGPAGWHIVAAIPRGGGVDARSQGRS
jgi:tetratricopeptide (TPR) repeat protein